MKRQASFDLDDHAAVNNHVDSLPRDDLALVPDPHHHFALDMMTETPKLTRKSLGVHGFEEAVSDRIVHLEEGPDDGTSHCFFGESDNLPWSHPPISGPVPASAHQSVSNRTKRLRESSRRDPNENAPSFDGAFHF